MVVAVVRGVLAVPVRPMVTVAMVVSRVLLAMVALARMVTQPILLVVLVVLVVIRVQREPVVSQGLERELQAVVVQPV